MLILGAILDTVINNFFDVFDGKKNKVSISNHLSFKRKWKLNFEETITSFHKQIKSYKTKKKWRQTLVARVTNKSINTAQGTRPCDGMTHLILATISTSTITLEAKSPRETFYTEHFKIIWNLLAKKYCWKSNYAKMIPFKIIDLKH